MFAELMRRAKEARILVVGDLMLDEYLFGHATRISPEAPVPVVDVVRRELRTGGAANVAHGLSVLGCKVELAGIVGLDDDGDRLREMMQEAGCATNGVVVDKERITTRKTRVVADRQQLLRVDLEERTKASRTDANMIRDYVSRRVRKCSALVLSDYAKGTLTDDLTRKLIELASKHGVPIIVDPKGDDYDKYRGATVVTPNHRELELAVGWTGPIEDLVHFGKGIRYFNDLQSLLVTRGADGMTLICAEGVTHIPAQAREVFDVSGAGDTVVAVLALALATGAGMERAARMANAAAGIAVGKIGTATVTPAELCQLDHDAGRKVVTLETLRAILPAIRSGRRVVFTNGCFDLLHAGHVRMLEEARARGDLLIVGVNGDASVRRLKGATRPVIPGPERMALLAALECVDYVVPFEDDDPLEMISALKPDVLVKGRGYGKDICGGNLVRSYGGEVVIVDSGLDISTTAIVGRLAGGEREVA